MKRVGKYGIGMLVVLFFRLLPHPPNVEPIMATMMPFAKKGGMVIGAAFALCAIVLYDLASGTLGLWSIMTASSYTIIGLAAGIYLKNKTRKHYILFAIIATLFYDAMTGIVTGVFFFGQSLSITVAGQIPFTMMHLAGNIVLAAIISPLLERWVVNNKTLDLTSHSPLCRKA